MAQFFPRHTSEFRVDDAQAFRRLSFNLVEMALVTGVVLRLYRSVVLTHESDAMWVYVVGIILGPIILCTMATGHLANFPLRRWTWRAPTFALVVVVGEMATSLLLIAVGREPTGTARAGFQDWPGMALSTLWTREILVCGWALLLALVVTVVRRGIVASELREKRARTGDPDTGG
ncbi:MAG TPA: hypothetical protein VFK16_04500 [Gemmatimonadaceae bacterium]|jgi:hypothetical protein|nr:hypothetical protein [Gemmatimonadaceae bacterium]